MKRKIVKVQEIVKFEFDLLEHIEESELNLLGENEITTLVGDLIDSDTIEITDFQVEERKIMLN